MLETVRAMMWLGVMTFQYSHRLFRPHALRPKQPWVEASPSVSTSGRRAHPMAPWLSSPRLVVSDTGVVSSVSTDLPLLVPPASVLGRGSGKLRSLGQVAGRAGLRCHNWIGVSPSFDAEFCRRD